MVRHRLLLIAVLLAAVAAFFLFDLGQYLTLEALKARQAELEQFRAEHPWTLATAYFTGYVIVTALSLPGATLMTLAGGAIFGLGQGLLLVSFASSLGATLAFLTARILLRGWVQGRFGDHIHPINNGIKQDGAFYLFCLRLVPLFPFFVINLAMGLTPIRAWTFYWVSQLGMLAGTAVYVNAGTQLGQLESLGGILSADLVLSFALLGLFPLAARKLVAWIRRRRITRNV